MVLYPTGEVRATEESIEHIVSVRALKRGYIVKGGTIEGPFGRTGRALDVDDEVFATGNEGTMLIVILERLGCDEITVRRFQHALKELL